MVDRKDPAALLSSDDEFSFLDFSSGTFSLSDDESVDLISRRKQRAIKEDNNEKPPSVTDANAAGNDNKEVAANTTSNIEGEGDTNDVAKKPSKIPVLKQLHKRPIGDIDFDSDGSEDSNSASESVGNAAREPEKTQKLRGKDTGSEHPKAEKDVIEPRAPDVSSVSPHLISQDLTDISISNKSTTSSSQSDQLSYSLSFSIGEEVRQLEVDDMSEGSNISITEEFEIDDGGLGPIREESDVQDPSSSINRNTSGGKQVYGNRKQVDDSVEVFVTVGQKPHVDEPGFQTTYAITAKERRTVKIEGNSNHSRKPRGSSSGSSGCCQGEELGDNGNAETLATVEEALASETRPCSVPGKENDNEKADTPTETYDRSRTCEGGVVTERPEKGEEKRHKGVRETQPAVGDLRKDETEVLTTKRSNNSREPLQKEDVNNKIAKEGEDQDEERNVNGLSRHLVDGAALNVTGCGDTEFGTKTITVVVTDETECSGTETARKGQSSEEENYRMDVKDCKKCHSEADDITLENIEDVGGDEVPAEELKELSVDVERPGEDEININKENTDEVVCVQKVEANEEISLQQFETEEDIVIFSQQFKEEEKLCVQRVETEERVCIQKVETEKEISAKQAEREEENCVQEIETDEEVFKNQVQESEVIRVNEFKLASETFAKKVGTKDKILEQNVVTKEETFDAMLGSVEDLEIAKNVSDADSVLESIGSTGSWIQSDIETRDSDVEACIIENNTSENIEQNVTVEADEIKILQPTLPTDGTQPVCASEGFTSHKEITGDKLTKVCIEEITDIIDDICGEVVSLVDSTVNTVEGDSEYEKEDGKSEMPSEEKTHAESVVFDQTLSNENCRPILVGSSKLNDRSVPNYSAENESTIMEVTMKTMIADESGDKNWGAQGDAANACGEVRVEQLHERVVDLTHRSEQKTITESVADVELCNQTSQLAAVMEVAAMQTAAINATTVDHTSLKAVEVLAMGMCATTAKAAAVEAADVKATAMDAAVMEATDSTDNQHVEISLHDNIKKVEMQEECASVGDMSTKYVINDTEGVCELQTHVGCNQTDQGVASIENRTLHGVKKSDVAGLRTVKAPYVSSDSILDKGNQQKNSTILSNKLQIELVDKVCNEETLKDENVMKIREEIPSLLNRPSTAASDSDIIDRILETEQSPEDSDKIDLKDKIRIGTYIRPALEGASFSSSKPIAVNYSPVNNGRGKVHSNDNLLYKDGECTEDDTQASLADTILDVEDSEEILESREIELAPLHFSYGKGDHSPVLQREVYGRDQIEEAACIPVNKKENDGEIGSTAIIEKKMIESTIAKQNFVAISNHVTIQSKIQNDIPEIVGSRKAVSEEHHPNVNAAGEQEMVSHVKEEIPRLSRDDVNHGDDDYLPKPMQRTVVDEGDLEAKNKVNNAKGETGDGQLPMKRVQDMENCSNSKVPSPDSKAAVLARLTNQRTSGKHKMLPNGNEVQNVRKESVENKNVLHNEDKKVVNDGLIIKEGDHNAGEHRDFSVVQVEEQEIDGMTERIDKVRNVKNLKEVGNEIDNLENSQECRLSRELANSLSDVSSIGFDEAPLNFEQKEKYSKNNRTKTVHPDGKAGRGKTTAEINHQTGAANKQQLEKKQDVEQAKFLIDQLVGIVSQLAVESAAAPGSAKNVAGSHQLGTKEDHLEEGYSVSSAHETYSAGHAANFFKDISFSEGPPTINERSAHVTYCKTLFSMGFPQNNEQSKVSKQNLPVADTLSRDGKTPSIFDGVSENTSVAVDTRDEIIKRLTGKEARASRFRSELNQFASYEATRRQEAASRCSGSYRENPDEVLTPALLAQLSEKGDPNLLMKFMMEQNSHEGKIYEEDYDETEWKSHMNRNERNTGVPFRGPSFHVGRISESVDSKIRDSAQKGSCERDYFPYSALNSMSGTRKDVVVPPSFPAVLLSASVDTGVQTDPLFDAMVPVEMSNRDRGAYYRTNAAAVVMNQNVVIPQLPGNLGGQPVRRMYDTKATAPEILRRYNNENTVIANSGREMASLMSANRLKERSVDTGVQTDIRMTYAKANVTEEPSLGKITMSGQGFSRMEMPSTLQGRRHKDTSEYVIGGGVQTEDVLCDKKDKTADALISEMIAENANERLVNRVPRNVSMSQGNRTLDRVEVMVQTDGFTKDSDEAALELPLGKAGNKCLGTSNVVLLNESRDTLKRQNIVARTGEEIPGANHVSVEIQHVNNRNCTDFKVKKNESGEDSVMVLIREMSELLSVDDDLVDRQFNETLKQSITKESSSNALKVTDIVHPKPKDSVLVVESGAPEATMVLGGVAMEKESEIVGGIEERECVMEDKASARKSTEVTTAVTPFKNISDSKDVGTFNLGENMMSKLDNVISNVNVLIDKTAEYAELKLSPVQDLDVEFPLQIGKDKPSEKRIDRPKEYSQNTTIPNGLPKQTSSFLLADSVDDYLSGMQVAFPESSCVASSSRNRKSDIGFEYKESIVAPPVERPWEKYSYLLKKSTSENRLDGKASNAVKATSSFATERQTHDLKDSVGDGTERNCVIQDRSDIQRSKHSAKDTSVRLSGCESDMEQKEQAISSVGNKFREENEEIKAASKRRLKHYLDNIMGFDRGDKGTRDGIGPQRGLNHESDFDPRGDSDEDTLEDEAILVRELRTTVGNTSVVRTESIKRKRAGGTTSLEREVSLRRVKKGRLRKSNDGRTMDEDAEFTEEVVQSENYIEKPRNARPNARTNRSTNPPSHSKDRENDFDYYDAEDVEFSAATLDNRGVNRYETLEVHPERARPFGRERSGAGRSKMKDVAKQLHPEGSAINRATQTLPDLSYEGNGAGSTHYSSHKRQGKNQYPSSASEYVAQPSELPRYNAHSQKEDRESRYNMIKELSSELDSYDEEKQQLLEKLKSLQKRESTLQASLSEESERLASLEQIWRQSQDELKNCNNLRNLEIRKEQNLLKIQQLESELKELKLAKKKGSKNNSEVLQRIELLEGMMASEEKQKTGYKEAVQKLLGFTEDVANRLCSAGYRNHKALAGRAKELALATRTLLENSNNVPI